MVPVDVYVVQPIGWTAPLVVSDAPSSSPYASGYGYYGYYGTRVDPAWSPLYGGVELDLGARRLKSGWLVVDGGVRRRSASWDLTPSFAASVTDAWADVGVRGEWVGRRMRPAGDHPTEAFLWRGSLAAGGAVVVLDPDWWPTHVNPALHGQGAAGIAVGGAHLRVALDLRTTAALRADHFEGTAQTADSQMQWSYWPGYVDLSWLIGLEVR